MGLVGLSLAFGATGACTRKVTFSKSTMKYLTVRSSLRSTPVRSPSMATDLPFPGMGLKFAQHAVLWNRHRTRKALSVVLVSVRYCTAWISKVASLVLMLQGSPQTCTVAWRRRSKFSGDPRGANYKECQHRMEINTHLNCVPKNMILDWSEILRVYPDGRSRTCGMYIDATAHVRKLTIV
ncbi:hypothetical protein DFH07DRAFT_799173 [Mycena maculata]|uniref:Uncharacterized protein n=1 Tax=Mycena maculata TaxID=230809 RepID=A0AAD7NUI2_9AGAR|nr:hypothetical protein DFH07DRAFT_799173 [Mycena maculata]